MVERATGSNWTRRWRRCSERQFWNRLDGVEEAMVEGNLITIGDHPETPGVRRGRCGNVTCYAMTPLAHYAQSALKMLRHVVQRRPRERMKERIVINLIPRLGAASFGIWSCERSKFSHVFDIPFQISKQRVVTAVLKPVCQFWHIAFPNRVDSRTYLRSLQMNHRHRGLRIESELW